MALSVRIVLFTLVVPLMATAKSEPHSPVLPKAKNIIIMINDGASWGTWQAASYWEFGALGKQVYDSFPVKLGVTTFPLVASDVPTFSSNLKQSYNSLWAWDTQPMLAWKPKAPRLPFVGYSYLNEGVTDSAAAATAMASGYKTHNGAINTDNFGKPLTYITQRAKAAGMATGVVTTVPFSHATPAAFSAQSISRLSYPDIARQMLSQDTVDLIVGAGSPEFDHNGIACDAPQAAKDLKECLPEKRYRFVGAPEWQGLKQRRLIPAGASQPWTLLQTLPEINAAITQGARIKSPLIVVPQVRASLQVERDLAVMGADKTNPSGIAYTPDLPNLAQLSQLALEYLAQKNGQGFFVMIEGGATDWAAHTSSLPPAQQKFGQLIEETQDFNHAVRSVVTWVEHNSSWDETLLIVTTDHGNGMVLGPDANKRAFQPVQNRGIGQLPGMSFQPLRASHANELVLLWAKGVGAELLPQRIKGRDLGFAQHVGHNNGDYIDNTDIGQVMAELIKVAP